ncbi:MAG: serine hydrolase [Bacteroidales bacterium]|nr:serine hydrolase [Bacteroidales bacterium]
MTFFTLGSQSQALYFPPLTGNEWETTDPASLGWCIEHIDELLQYLEEKDSKAFILLKDGKIAIEAYFGSFTQDSLWYWASAGKTLTAFMVGLAQEQNHVSIGDSTSKYLGAGWTNCSPEQEGNITIWHQLTMTSGLDDGVPENHCTLDTCLNYLAESGTRWAYHNAPYTLLDELLKEATGQTLNSFVFQKLTQPTGISGAFIKLGYNNVFFSKPRSMARFGLLMLNRGNWDGNQVMADMDYFYAMITPSQTLNKSYGYLWWLNGQESFMLPGLQLVLPGPMFPNAPANMHTALGMNGQILNVVHDMNLVMLRLGNDPGAGPLSAGLNDSIWRRLKKVLCEPTFVSKPFGVFEQLKVFPNPAKDLVSVELPGQDFHLSIFTLTGKAVLQQFGFRESAAISIEHLPQGVYFLRLTNKQKQSITRKLVIRP